MYIVRLTSTETTLKSPVFNPWCTCAARVTVVGSVCLLQSHFTNGTSVGLENAVTKSVGNEGRKTCEDLPAFKSYATKHERKGQLPIISTYTLSVLSA